MDWFIKDAENRIEKLVKQINKTNCVKTLQKISDLVKLRDFYIDIKEHNKEVGLEF